jgi:hypothetical protein
MPERQHGTLLQIGVFSTAVVEFVVGLEEEGMLRR